MATSPDGGLRIFGFPVRVSPFFFLICAILKPPSSFEGVEIAKLAIWIALVGVSVLWHELGHAFAMRRYGYSPSIELYGMGGLTRWNAGPAPIATQRLIVSLAGPFAGFALGAVIGGVRLLIGDLGHWALEYTVYWLLVVNIGWGFVNLLPMVPWDGGHALHGFLDWVTKGRGAKPTAVVTLVLGVVLLALTALVWRELWAAFLVIISLAAGWRLWRGADAAPPRPAPAHTIGGMREVLAKLGPEAIVSHVLFGRSDPMWANAAKSIEKDVLGREMSIGGRAHALELSAWANLLAGDVNAAQRALDRMPTTHEPSIMLEALLAAKLDHPDDALEAAKLLDGEDEAGARIRIETYALIALRRYDDAIARIDAADRMAGSFVVEQLFRAGNHDAAAIGAERLFARFSHPEDAYNAACSHSRAGRPLEAISWIERAIEAGYRDLDHLDQDEDLAPIRSLPEFARLRERVK